jgi:hypothetical protein
VFETDRQTADETTVSIDVYECEWVVENESVCLFIFCMLSLEPSATGVAVFSFYHSVLTVSLPPSPSLPGGDVHLLLLPIHPSQPAASLSACLHPCLTPCIRLCSLTIYEYISPSLLFLWLVNQLLTIREWVMSALLLILLLPSRLLTSTRGTVSCSVSSHRPPLFSHSIHISHTTSVACQINTQLYYTHTSITVTVSSHSSIIIS